MKQKHSSKLQIIAAALGVVASLMVLVVWCMTQHDWQIREQLKIIAPLFLEFTMIGILCTAGAALALLFQRRSLQDIFTRCSFWTLSALCILVLGGAALLVWVVPRDHRIYYDEDIYENVAQNIAMTKGGNQRHDDKYSQWFSGLYSRVIGSAGMCNEGRNQYGEYTCYRLEYNKEPNAWPHLLSIVYRLAGVSEPLSFVTTNLIFLTAIIVVYWIGVLLFHSRAAGLYSALVFTLTPEVLIWSNTVAAEPGAAAFAAAAVLSMLVFLRYRKTIFLLLTALILAYASQFRPESIMIGAVVGVLLMLEAPDELRHSRFWWIFALFVALIVPLLAHLFAVRSMGWGASGAKFSLSYFTSGNFRVNSLFYLVNMRFPLLFTVLFFLGLLLKDRVGCYLWRPRLVLIVWFLLFWGIFLFFYAGSYNYGADVRFSVLSAVPIAVLAGNGARNLGSLIARKLGTAVSHTIVTLIILGAFLPFLPFVRAISQEAWAARADHHFAHEMLPLLPDTAVVLTHNPNMFLVWGKNAAQASLATEQKAYFSGFFSRYPGGVYFHYNFWCNVNDPLQNSFCKNILAWYTCTPVITFKEQNQEFALYKVERK